ncbi:hypothetical protein FAI40_06270 [Acetobacteraceae bacterium]|nr:hypothetical protein FAI40_06125 [Acetobacteraceae bacterium]QCE34978.1 hypothetical protein FAI40_06270 [Acetobacteraceae bacterium]
MSQRSIVQKFVLILFTLGAGASLYALFEHNVATHHAHHKAETSKDTGISGYIDQGVNEVSHWWNGDASHSENSISSDHAPSAKALDSDTEVEKIQVGSEERQQESADKEDDKDLSDTLSALESKSDSVSAPVFDSYAKPTSKVLKEREKVLLANRAVQEKKNQAIQRARAQEINKTPKMLFKSDVMQAKKDLGFSPQGYHLWENANGFLLLNPKTLRFELVLETENCAGALGQDTPELKQVFSRKKINEHAETLTLFQANQEGQSAKDSLSCQVGLKFKDGKVIQASEKNCTYWHGAECAFSVPLKGLRALPDLK